MYASRNLIAASIVPIEASARPADEEELDRLLKQWADYMQTYEPARGLPRAAAFSRMAGSSRVYATATELMEESVTPWEIKTVDTCIDDMQPELRIIIHCEHVGMTVAVFRYKRIPTDKDAYQKMYADARADLKRRLRMKGLAL